MTNRDVIEYYNGNQLIARTLSSMVPTMGSFISVKGNTWEVVGISYALDNSDEPALCGMRANVDLKAC